MHLLHKKYLHVSYKTIYKQSIYFECHAYVHWLVFILASYS